MVGRDGVLDWPADASTGSITGSVAELSMGVEVWLALVGDGWAAVAVSGV
jgi:hypothetical protein